MSVGLATGKEGETDASADPTPARRIGARHTYFPNFLG